MNSLQLVDNMAFAGLLTSDFINACIPDSGVDSEVELIKGKAGRLALTIFDAGKRDLHFNESTTFGDLFPQEKYGAGFTKALSTLVAYEFMLTPGLRESSAMEVFASKVHTMAQEVFQRLDSPHKDVKNFSSLNKEVNEKIDNFGGYYGVINLSETGVQNLIPNRTFSTPLTIDAYSGHLVAALPNFSENLLEAYRAEIETHLTETGRANLGLPNNTGFVIVAYKDELEKIPAEKMETLLQQSVNLSFKSPYIVPVRGDNRYVSVASIFVESSDISDRRKEMGMKELYSEGRPLRYTFAAVYNMLNTAACDDQLLVEKMRLCSSLNPLMSFIDVNLQLKTWGFKIP